MNNYTYTYVNNSKIQIPTVQIHFRKRNLKLLIFLSIIMLLVGIWLAFFPHDFQLTIARLVPLNNTVLGILLMTLCVYATISLYKKTKQEGYAIIIDENGITSNYTQMSLGLIKWEDITKFEVVKVYSTEIVQISFNNKRDYINALPDSKKKFYLKSFPWLVQSKVAIPMSGVDISTADLKKVLTNAYNAYLQNKGGH